MASARNNLVIAIDGTFASGKGTLARRIASHYGLAYLDTGKLYRAVGLAMLKAGAALTDHQYAADIARTLDPSTLDNPELKSNTVASAASQISVFPDVRAALFAYQQAFASQPGGAVLDGRDIGTVICPDAPIKLYIDAKPEIRAKRRHTELVGYGDTISYEDVLRALKERDHRDSTRDEAPLKPADDAHLLDTTDLSIDTVFERASALIDAVIDA